MVFMNNRGQAIFYTFMIAIVVVLLAMSLSPIVGSFVNDARGPSSETAVGLDCSNESISDYQKSQCVLTDAATPYYFYGMIAIGLLIIGAKVIL